MTAASTAPVSSGPRAVPASQGGGQPKQQKDQTQWGCAMWTVLALFIFCGCGTQYSADAVWNKAVVRNRENTRDERYGAWMIVVTFGMAAEGFCLLVFFAMRLFDRKGQEAPNNDSIKGQGSAFDGDKSATAMKNEDADDGFRLQKMLVRAHSQNMSPSNEENNNNKTSIKFSGARFVAKRNLTLVDQAEDNNNFPAEEEQKIYPNQATSQLLLSRERTSSSADVLDAHVGDDEDDSRFRFCDQRLLRFMFSGVFDVLSASFTLTSFMAVSPAVNQVCRCSRLAFNGILNRVFFAKKLQWFQIVGILGCSLGIAMQYVGKVYFPLPAPPTSGPTSRGLMDEFKLTDAAPATGITIALAGNFLGSIQHCLQAQFFQQLPKTPATVVVGIEGWTGTMVAVLFIMPMLYLLGSIHDNQSPLRPPLLSPDQTGADDSAAGAAPGAGVVITVGGVPTHGYSPGGEQHRDGLFSGSFLFRRPPGGAAPGAGGSGSSSSQFLAGGAPPQAVVDHEEGSGVLLFFAKQKQILLTGIIQFFNSRSLQLAMLSYFIFNAIVCSVGSVVGKKLESSGRAILECVRIIAVWSFEIPYMFWKYDGDWAAVYQLKFDYTETGFWMEKLAFLLIAAATLVYFEVVKFACLGSVLVVDEDDVSGEKKYKGEDHDDAKMLEVDNCYCNDEDSALLGRPRGKVGVHNEKDADAEVEQNARRLGK
ncbi:unnamed protein product [Amoebophrya sp. A120]|nr:unnamed protein product [Amoebophrya sp. A120]|eukprot:GSA120T00010549001.1